MISTEKKSRPTVSIETLLRFSVMVFWVMLGVQVFTATATKEEANYFFPPFISIFGFLGFGPAFWINTRNIAFQKPGWQPALLLAYQALCGFMINTDLLYIVAAEIPLVLPGRMAFTWIVVQNLMLIAWVLWLDHIGGPVSFLELPQLPHFLNVVLTHFSVFSIHAFAFFMGYLAASEARGRRDAERLNAELLATQDLLAQSSRLAERAFVARELHDALGHHLVALKVNLELAQNLVVEGSAKTPINDALSLIKRLLSEVRGVVSNVRTQPRMELRKAIETLLAGISELSIELVFPDDFQISDPSHAHVLFRCVQEAVTNTLKHAKAKKLRIEFRNDQSAVYLTVRDDGMGVANLEQNHGLKGMRERLESVNGELDIASAPRRGFTLTARIAKPDRL
ncbi:MAG: sensor histidine kinase [Methyloglobulus sp.]|nr:sensor histidine kinase [Methyloglobulus sp.]